MRLTPAGSSTRGARLQLFPGVVLLVEDGRVAAVVVSRSGTVHRYVAHHRPHMLTVSASTVPDGEGES